MKKQPNIIVFMTDQQNAQSMDPNGPIKTPNMDGFLKRSIRLTENYCPSPHCCPCRASFFSSLMPSQHGVWNNVEVCNCLSRGLHDGVTLFPEILKENGYKNIFSGKWHVSAVEGPADRGFDEVLSEHSTNYGRLKECKNVQSCLDWERVYSNKDNIDAFDEKKEFGKIIRPGYPHYYQFGIKDNPFNDTTTVDLACDRLKEYDDNKPLFMFIGTTGPHDPYTPPQKFLDMYDIDDIELPPNFHDDMNDKPALYRRTKEQFALSEEEHLESIRRYYAFCTYEDALFGKVLDTVEKKCMMDDTIIIYLTDHGDYLGAHGLWAKGLPCFKEAYNICGVIGGGDIPGGWECNEFVSLMDFFPTILDFAGIDIPTNIKGHSIKDMVYGVEKNSKRKEMYTQSNGNEIYGIQRAVYDKKWKYVLNTFDYDELYDLENDPYEMNNLYGKPEHESVVKKMCKKLWQHAKDNQDNCTCPYIMVSLASYGPGIIHFD